MTLPLERLWEKIARGYRLSENEILDLKLQARKIDEVKTAAGGWLTQGSSEPSVRTLTADRVDLIVPPGNPFMAYWQDSNVANQFAILNSVWTALDLSDTRLTIRKDNPCVVRMVGTKIYSNFPNSYISLAGRVFYAETGNITNNRHTAIGWYDSTNALLERRTLAYWSAASTSNIVFNSFKFSTHPSSTDTGQYFQFEVLQDSGVTLHISALELMIALAFR